MDEMTFKDKLWAMIEGLPTEGGDSWASEVAMLSLGHVSKEQEKIIQQAVKETNAVIQSEEGGMVLRWSPEEGKLRIPTIFAAGMGNEGNARYIFETLSPVFVLALENFSSVNALKAMIDGLRREYPLAEKDIKPRPVMLDEPEILSIPELGIVSLVFMHPTYHQRRLINQAADKVTKIATEDGRSVDCHVEAEKISFKIPVGLVEGLDEKRAQYFLEALEPVVSLVKTIEGKVLDVALAPGPIPAAVRARNWLNDALNRAAPVIKKMGFAVEKMESAAEVYFGKIPDVVGPIYGLPPVNTLKNDGEGGTPPTGRGPSGQGR